MPYRDYEIVHRYFTLRVGRKLLQDDMRKFRTNEASVHMADLYRDLIERALTHIESKLTALEGRYIRVHKTDDPLAYDVKVGNHRGLFFVNRVEIQLAVSELVKSVNQSPIGQRPEL